MPILNLKNITIEERSTINGDIYFTIKDNEQNQVYFCFQNKLKESWNDLASNKDSIKEVEIEFEESERGNKVVSLYVSKGDEIFI